MVDSESKSAGGPSRPQGRGEDAAGEKLSGWRRLPDIDGLYHWVTILVIAVFVVTTRIKSEIFILYAILFIAKIRKSGYRRCGLEIYLATAVLGLALSYLGTWDGHVLRNVFRVAKIISLPLLMSQFGPFHRLFTVLAVMFGAMGGYGLFRMSFFPIVSGYAKNRAYAFSDFFMVSSVIAFSGYLFFLVALIRMRGYLWKSLSAAGVLTFAYLVLVHSVRASFVAFLLLTPLIVLVEFRRRLPAAYGAMILGGAIFILGIGALKPAALENAWMRIQSISDFDQGSNQGRLAYWRKALEVFAENPVNGIGYKRFNYKNVPLEGEKFDWAFYHAHNEPLGMLAETGIIGTAAWLLFKIQLLLLFFRRHREGVAAFAVYLFLAFEVHNLFEVYLNERTAYIYVYLLFGIILNQLAAGERSLSESGVGRDGT